MISNYVRIRKNRRAGNRSHVAWGQTPRKFRFHALFVQFIKVFRFFDFTNRQLMFEMRASGKTDGQTIF
jgi:hypothetical protein